jgi:hypothetical protein
MKTQKTNGQSLYLKTANNRWKWMAGATAATAAGVTASEASLITINLSNNYISATGGNHLNADLTGDGHPDLAITGTRAYYRHFSRTFSTGYVFTFNDSTAAAFLNGVRAEAFFYGDGYGHSVRLGSRHDYSTLTGSIPVFFKDLHINGGAPTRGSLGVTVSDFGGVKIQLDSFTYNIPGQGSRSLAVPDQGSSLALLALGASGILALRRWRAAQEQS